MKEQRGSSMVEMIGVIGLLGVVAAGGYTLISSAMYRYRISQGVAQLQTLQKGISRLYASAGNYDALAASDAIKVLIDNNVPMSNMRAGSNALRHAFGGEVLIKNVENEEDETSDSFTITFKDLDNKQCASMAAASWGDNDSSRLVSIKVGNSNFVWPSVADNVEASGVLPVTESKAMDVCNNAPLNITWEFR